MAGNASEVQKQLIQIAAKLGLNILATGGSHTNEEVTDASVLSLFNRLGTQYDYTINGGSPETIQVSFADTGNLTTGSFMKFGVVTCNGTPAWVAPFDYNIVKISISRTDTDAADMEVLVDSVVVATIATAATVTTAAVSASMLEGKGLCIRNKVGGNTVSNVIVTLILQRA